MLVMDHRGHVLNYNRAFEQLVGRDQASELRAPEYSLPANHPLDMLLSGESSVCWTGDNKTKRHFKVHFIDLEGETHTQARVFIDVSEQAELEQSHAKLNEELKQHVLTDTIMVVKGRIATASKRVEIGFSYVGCLPDGLTISCRGRKGHKLVRGVHVDVFCHCTKSRISSLGMACGCI